MDGQEQCEQSLPERISRIQNQIIMNQTGVPEEAKRTIQIQEVVNGFIVQVGCKTIVFETREKLLSELERYLKDRRSVEKEYLEKGK